MKRSCRIVVGEGDTAMRRRLVRALTGDGYRVREATDGLTLVDELEFAAYTGWRDELLVVADLHLSGLSGVDVLTALRLARWRIPVILIGDSVDRDDIDDIIDAARLGAAVITQPFGEDALLRLVHEAASQEIGKAVYSPGLAPHLQYPSGSAGPHGGAAPRLSAWNWSDLSPREQHHAYQSRG